AVNGIRPAECRIGVEGPILSEIQVGQNTPQTTRVVLHLTRSAKFWVYHDPQDPTDIIIESGYPVLGAEFVGVGDGGILSIPIQGGPVEYIVSTLSSPDRVIVDVQKATLLVDGFERKFDHPIVESIKG